MNFINHKAIYKLYPTVTRIHEDKAYDINDNEVAYDVEAVQELTYKFQCEEKAKRLLVLTDWAVLPDVDLKNADEFKAYRLELRKLATDPVANPNWPVEPKPIWN